MSQGRQKYVKRTPIVAVQLDLETNGFTYRKWGSQQTCKARDWIVNSDGDVYTVDQQSFARTYKKDGVGTFLKTTPIWAEVAAESGSVKTKEGETHYNAGDYLVSNEEDGGDAYAISAKKFNEMYAPAE